MDTRSLGTRSFVTKRGLLILFAAMLLLAFVASEQALAHSRGNHQRGDMCGLGLRQKAFPPVVLDERTVFSHRRLVEERISVRDLQAFLEPESVGKTIAVSLIRGGQPATVNVTIGERKRKAD